MSLSKDELELIKKDIEYDSLDPKYYYDLFRTLMLIVPLDECLKIVLKELRGTKIRLNFLEAFDYLDPTIDYQAEFF